MWVNNVPLVGVVKEKSKMHPVLVTPTAQAPVFSRGLDNTEQNGAPLRCGPKVRAVARENLPTTSKISKYLGVGRFEDHTVTPASFVIWGWLVDPANGRRLALDTVVVPTGDQNACFERFKTGMLEDLEISPHFVWSDIDLYMFPMLQDGHFYLMSVDIRRNKLDIIDNSTLKPHGKDKYGDIPENLLLLLSMFLDFVKLDLIAVKLGNIRPKRMQMKWRDSTHSSDSGVYTMRHMESYFGQGVKEWSLGLQKGDRRPLSELRKRFAHNILMADINVHKVSIAKRAWAYKDKIFR
nr:uncharacterized protein LOC109155623 isoform X2 [Ipomoea batatas]